MIREPYIGMPIIIGGNPGYVPDPVTRQQNPPLHAESSHYRNSEGQQNSGFDARLLGSLPLAMTYTPMQQWKTTYSSAEALKRGTVFPELELPFEGRMGK